MLTHYNIVAQAMQMGREEKLLNYDSDSQLGLLPFFHIYVSLLTPKMDISVLTQIQGLMVVLGTSMSVGVTCIVLPKFDVEKACRLIQDHRLTFMYVPPPVVLALGKHPVVSKYDLSSMRWINSAAAPLSKELAVAVWDRLRIGVKQGYGLSETSPACMVQLSEEWMKFQGSVGRLFPNMEAKIVDEDGKELGYNEVSQDIAYEFCSNLMTWTFLARRASSEGTKRFPGLLEQT
jgi:acyl-coenzyme A synthetase/AMP-(fatty) acid ligase